jgi:hypothetical protein
MGTIKKKSVGKKWWFWIIVASVIIIIGKQGGNSASRDEGARRTEQSGSGNDSAPTHSVAVKVDLVDAKRPAAEAEFIRIVSSAQNQARGANNDMQKGGIKAERDRAICLVMQNLGIQGWTGRVSKIDANSDGKGVLVIEIAKDIFVKTWNNSFSDVMDNTLLEPGSPVFVAASAMQKGTPVSISGEFVKGSSGECIKESSLSLSGKLRDPEFVFRFNSVAVLSDSTPVAETPSVPVKTSEAKPQPVPNLVEVAATDQIASQQPIDIAKYLGKHPVELFKDQIIQKRFKLLIGGDYDHFIQNLDVGSELKLEGDYYVGTGLAAHMGGVEESAYAVSKMDSKAYAVIFTDGQNIRWFGAAEAKDLPPPLYAWYKDHGGT